MIIGLTIHDNDFQDVLANFAEQIGKGNFVMEEPPKGSISEQNEWYSWEWRTCQACRDIVQLVKLGDDDTHKSFLIGVIQRSWKAFISGRDDAEYLSDRLEVTIPETIDTQWQNGEQFYVFPTSYQNHVLCF